MDSGDDRTSDDLIQEIDGEQRCLEYKNNCTGFKQHAWRIVCDNCKCERECHDIHHNDFVNVRDRTGLQNQLQSNESSFKRNSTEERYAWIPPNLSRDKIQEYFVQIPSQKVPLLGTPGEKHREKQLIIQLPKQDFSPRYCKFLEKEYLQHYADFVNERQRTAYDIAYVKNISEQTSECYQCRGNMIPGNIAVVVPRLGERYPFHPACFVCSICKELLVDLNCCIKNEKIYCERHYAEQIRSRCAACDELIFTEEYIRAMSKDWHTTHFCCWKCNDLLRGQQYLLRDEHPYCVLCYEILFSNTCNECGRSISVDSMDLFYKNKHWHDSCFLCSKCRDSLIYKPFGFKTDKVYCASCYDAAFATKCDVCGEIFRTGTKKIEYNGKQWHEKCFCCIVCTNSIGTKSFIHKDNDIYCITCYEQKFFTRCIKCNQVITTDGVTYGNEPWHRECFCCPNCQRCLNGELFTSKFEKPYCAKCFGELFTKICHACNIPITGIGGTRFVSFEDRSWHTDCFLCDMCKKSLVGIGFISDGSDILCPECTRKKLSL
ncbi:four and a half LIM domains protein 2-like isoform X1 [Centruroides sculpturatus]|uniref:four and a half LIM domains protein 2-like isoform X1 n=1 Tax=Centruroides sculpturatus TaxID=218467 RepID=UPI000C6CD642|nr:four and a half LIM domains protein 2-like isoform X1 [Centruroides sculpturatus]